MNITHDQNLRQHWRDGWDPLGILETSGFGFLRHAENVNGVGANEDGEATDIVVSYKRGGVDVLAPVKHGASQLEVLRTRLRDVFETCGDMHWASQTDIVAVAERLNIGFIIFSSEEQGRGRWIAGTNMQRGDFPLWMCIYWDAPVHYRLGRLTCNGRSRVWFAENGVPRPIRTHYNLCNGSSHMGRADYGGVS